MDQQLLLYKECRLIIFIRTLMPIIDSPIINSTPTQDRLTITSTQAGQLGQARRKSTEQQGLVAGLESYF